jgi:hypothetical protein
MSTIVELESNPALTETDLLAALTAQGIEARVVKNRRSSDDGALVTMRLRNKPEDVSRRLLAALDEAIEQHGRPLICSSLGEFGYAIHPPAA